MLWTKTQRIVQKENAKQSVSPVRILQGQVLIQEGHIITQEDLRLLKLLGIDGNSSNYHQLYSYLIFLTILFVSLLAFSFRFKMGSIKQRVGYTC